MREIYQTETLTTLTTPTAEVVVFAKGWSDVNEDAAAVWNVGDALFLAVADGVGGGPRGELASRTALETVSGKHASIEEAFEAANRKVHALRGPACTLVVAQILHGGLTTLHAGDSQTIVVGGRGKLKHATTPHTVAGLGERAGLLDEDEAEVHPERHIVTNCLGDKVVRIERTSWGTLALRDTVLVASDGLFDNVTKETIAATICSGSIGLRVNELVELTRAAMSRPTGKPDDLTIAAWRRRTA